MRRTRHIRHIDGIERRGITINRSRIERHRINGVDRRRDERRAA
jgi:hypothetical protein